MGDEFFNYFHKHTSGEKLDDLLAMFPSWIFPVTCTQLRNDRTQWQLAIMIIRFFEQIDQEWFCLNANNHSEWPVTEYTGCNHSNPLKEGWVTSFGDVGTKSVRGDGRHYCQVDQCSKSYSRPHLLRRHVQVVHEGQTYDCSWDGCGKSYQSAFALASHVSIIRGFHQGSCADISDENKKVTPDERFPCTVEGCEKTFKFQQSVLEHVKNIRERKDVTRLTDETERTSVISMGAPKSSTASSRCSSI